MLGVIQWQAPVEIPTRPGSSGLGKLPGLGSDVLAVLGVGLVLLVLLLLWAKYIRKRSHRHSDPRITYRVIDDGGSGDEGGSHRRRRRHKRRRREHRGRNPTLAETGGLPPPRPQDEAPPSV
jgi:hypothetical protein